MVDEYHSPAKRGPLSKISSDSSMVDEYIIYNHPVTFSFLVQIPLWSMNTNCYRPDLVHPISSDSSMVDEYEEASRGGERILTSSDSSMVDEYHATRR